MKSAQEKAEKAEQEKEKIRTEFANYKKATHQVNDLIERCKENENLKEDLEYAKNVSPSL